MISLFIKLLVNPTVVYLWTNDLSMMLPNSLFRVKRWHLIIILLLSGGLLAFLPSCDKQSCQDVQCGYRQTCVNGDCVCPNGYEGDNCQIESRDKFLGRYQVYKNCYDGGPSESYNTHISIGNNVENVVINNIANLGLGAEAIVRGNNIRIPEQNVGATQVYGQGTYNKGSNSMNLQITYTQGGRSYNCECSYQKQ